MARDAYDPEVRNLLFVCFLALLAAWTVSLITRFIRLQEARISVGRKTNIVKPVSDVLTASFRRFVEEQESGKQDAKLLPGYVFPFQLAYLRTDLGLSSKHVTAVVDAASPAARRPTGAGIRLGDEISQSLIVSSPSGIGGTRGGGDVGGGGETSAGKRALAFFDLQDDSGTAPPTFTVGLKKQHPGLSVEARLLCVVDEDDLVAHASTFGMPSKASAAIPYSPPSSSPAVLASRPYMREGSGTEGGGAAGLGSGDDPAAHRRQSSSVGGGFRSMSISDDEELGALFSSTAHGLLLSPCSPLRRDTSGAEVCGLSTTLWPEVLQHMDEDSTDFPLVVALSVGGRRRSSTVVPPSALRLSPDTPQHKRRVSFSATEGLDVDAPTPRGGSSPTNSSDAKVVAYYVGAIKYPPADQERRPSSTPLPPVHHAAVESTGTTQSPTVLQQQTTREDENEDNGKEKEKEKASAKGEPESTASSPIEGLAEMSSQVLVSMETIASSTSDEVAQHARAESSPTSSRVMSWFSQRRKSLQGTTGTAAGPSRLPVDLTLKYIAVNGQLRLLKDVYLPQELSQHEQEDIAVHIRSASSGSASGIALGAASPAVVLFAAAPASVERTEHGDSPTSPPGLDATRGVSHETSGGFDCVICYSNIADTVTLPCMHCVVCASCVRRLSTCPLCRQDVDSLVTIFLT